ncbi:MAG: GyrI-like domain-containing protein [Bacteroidota bacterium]
MEKIDYKKQLKHLYGPSAKAVGFVEVPEMNFLMVDGQGNPNTAKAYKEAVEALYAVSYTLKFMVKKGDIGIDYGVMPLEGLWWVDDMSQFDPENKDEWKWTSMIMQPELITQELVAEALEQVRKKKNPKALDKIRFTSFHEGKAAQLLHIGPFSEEGPNIEKVHHAIAEKGFERTGKHHEIYLSDIRRAAPEKWKTVIRQPYR